MGVGRAGSHLWLSSRRCAGCLGLRQVSSPGRVPSGARLLRSGPPIAGCSDRSDPSASRARPRPTARRWRGTAAAALVSGVLLLCFTLAIGANLRHDRRVTCACFGTSSTEPVAGADMARNMLLLTCAAAVAAAEFAQVAVPDAVSERLAAVMVAALLTVSWQLGRASTRVALALRHLSPQDLP